MYYNNVEKITFDLWSWWESNLASSDHESDLLTTTPRWLYSKVQLFSYLYIEYYNATLLTVVMLHQRIMKIEEKGVQLITKKITKAYKEDHKKKSKHYACWLLKKSHVHKGDRCSYHMVKSNHSCNSMLKHKKGIWIEERGSHVI